MTNRSKFRDRIFTVLFMFIITLITVSSVSALHLATRSIVKRNEAMFLRAAILSSAGIQLPDSSSGISELFDRTVTMVPGSKDTYAINTGEQLTAFVRKGPGLWGDITAVVCVNPGSSELVGVTFTEQNETPGLGARIKEEWYQKQFRGRKGTLKLRPEGTRSAKTDEIDAITGATVTSKAVCDIVNRALEEARGKTSEERQE
jgi:Na+-transporting NADH:ubiquinone oxidoreductase subunit C